MRVKASVGPNALHRGQGVHNARSEIGIAGNDLSHASVEQEEDIGFEPRQATFTC